MAPIEDTPAYRAGVQALDHISKVDGESTKDMTLLDAVHRMRGPKGTKVTLTVIREGVDEEIVVDLIRDEITIQSVRSRMLEDDIGYLRITQFQEQTAKDQEKGFERAERERTAVSYYRPSEQSWGDYSPQPSGRPSSLFRPASWWCRLKIDGANVKNIAQTQVIL